MFLSRLDPCTLKSRKLSHFMQFPLGGCPLLDVYHFLRRLENRLFLLHVSSIAPTPAALVMSRSFSSRDREMCVPRHTQYCRATSAPPPPNLRLRFGVVFQERVHRTPAVGRRYLLANPAVLLGNNIRGRTFHDHGRNELKFPVRG